MKLLGKNAIITGANQGFGFAVAKAFVKEGANVVICARNAEALQKATQELKTIAPNATILGIPTDVTNAKQMQVLINTALDKLSTIDIVIANAGVYGTKGSIEEIDWQEWSDAIDINLKGTVLLCKLVVPQLKKQRYGKIILLSGGGATKPMPFLSAYAASKAAVVRFAETLAEELKDFHIDVNSIAPGALNTRLLEEVINAGPEKVGKAFYEQSLKQKAQGGTSSEVGAALCVYLASAESDGITGKLISAVWDPWRSLKNFKEELMNSDIYTLRRITPKDRNQDWGDL